MTWVEDVAWMSEPPSTLNDPPSTLNDPPSTIDDPQSNSHAAPAAIHAQSQRLVSLDVFRGIVIFAMLLVNNLGDDRTTGYFWKHADWFTPWLAGALGRWWHELRAAALPWYGGFTQFPLFRQCTLADYVMPSFMLIIGLAIPYSVASSRKRGTPPGRMWLRTIRRAAVLVILGWILCYFRDQFPVWLYAQPAIEFRVYFGMDVLQLLGVSYLAARLAYALPHGGRIALAAGLLLWHWAFLRFAWQGEAPRGSFTEAHNAIAYAYAHWRVWDATTLHLGRLSIGWIGMLSVPPATATMLLGTLAGDWLRRRDISDALRVRRLWIWGALLAALGFIWALDLPFNKPRWSPCYLVYVTGVGFMLLAALYWIIDMKRVRWWVYPFVVFGINAIAAYVIPIMAKVLIGNTIRIRMGGQTMNLTHAAMASLKSALGDWAGGWMFTLLFIAFWWLVLQQMYRRKWFWKV